MLSGFKKTNYNNMIVKHKIKSVKPRYRSFHGLKALACPNCRNEQREKPHASVYIQCMHQNTNMTNMSV